MKVILAEKPSVAREIAGFVGAGPGTIRTWKAADTKSRGPTGIWSS